MSSWPDLHGSQLSLSLGPERHIFQVRELNAAVQRLFDAEFRSVSVAGEISGCHQAASGHYYFSLKDEISQVKCVLFKGSARFVRFKPQNGLAVIVRGNLDVYEARGEYQLLIDSLEPQGAGALQLAFEQLKQKLSDEGLFEASRKRPLPKLPRRIGLITSPSGAVIRDILHVLERRFRGLHVRVFPVQVQGEGAADQVCAGLRFFSRESWPEVVIVARGGGSIEDLWTFNEESVARAISASKIPVITAIGHETDFTISDFVADHRAPTPSAAAEIVVRTSESLLEQLDVCRGKALQAVRYRIVVSSQDLHRRGVERSATLIHRRVANCAQRLDNLDERLRSAQRLALEGYRKQFFEWNRRLEANNLRLRFANIRHRSELGSERLAKVIQSILWTARKRYEAFVLHLSQLSPLAILERGYAIVEKPTGGILRSAEETTSGDRLNVRLHRGELSVTVDATYSRHDR